MPSLVEFGLVVLKKKLFSLDRCISTILLYYLPLVKDIVLHLNLNLFTKECFLPNLILKKKTFKLQYFLCAISNNLPLEMGVARHLNKFEPPPLPNLAYIDLVILEEKIFKYRKCIFLQIS